MPESRALFEFSFTTLSRYAMIWFCLWGGCKSGPDLSADYAQTANENYEHAVAEFADKDWAEAIQYADFVRIRFPFSRYAVEAELLIARAEFKQHNYLTSQDGFKQFAKLHPTHQHVRNGWVSYMAAAAAFMTAPRGAVYPWPAHYQRDQTPLHETLAELAYYFDRYAGTVTESHASKLRDNVQRRLLEHELYVAQFYLDRDKTEAAVGRLEAAHTRYPTIGLNAEVSFLLGITYLRMHEIELARSTFADLQSKHPDHHHGKQAQLYLSYIYTQHGAADPNRTRPSRRRPVPRPPLMPKNRDQPHHPERAPKPAVKPKKIAPTQATSNTTGAAQPPSAL